MSDKDTKIAWTWEQQREAVIAICTGLAVFRGDRPPLEQKLVDEIAEIFLMLVDSFGFDAVQAMDFASKALRDCDGDITKFTHRMQELGKAGHN